jgi:nicotinamide mononucleotide transporter
LLFIYVYKKLQLTLAEFWAQFVEGMKNTSPLEYIAVFAGIVSVWFSRKENILVYPVGLINTIIYIYLSFVNHLPGEASVNFYYTIMSFYGWYLWLRKDQQQQPVLHISYSDKRIFSFLLYSYLFLSCLFKK